MYFPHAYLKMLVATNVVSPLTTAFAVGNGTLNTLNLAAGQVGVVDAATNLLIDIIGTPTYGATPMFYLAQGSFYASDKLGPFHGGYHETVKSKGINPKYISEFYVTEPKNAVNQIVKVDAAGCVIDCETTYRLRVDIKGSPALRFLSHNLYKTLSAYSGCCVATSTGTQPIDPNVILLQWKDEIIASPILTSYVLPKVWNFTVTTGTTSANAISTSTTTAVFALDAYTSVVVGQKVTGTGIPANSIVTTVNGTTSITITFPALSSAPSAATFNNIAGLKFYTQIATSTYTPVTPTVTSGVSNADSHIDLIGAYVNTSFGDCSFNPMDHYEIEPISIYTSVVDNSNDPCLSSCFNSTETQQAYQGKGYGETLLRELILTKRYQQLPWTQDVRLSEVLGDTTMTELSRSSKYYTYNLVHSIPRKSNPSGMLDADQYHVKVVTASRDADFEDWISDLMVSAGNPGPLTGGTAIKVLL